MSHAIRISVISVATLIALCSTQSAAAGEDTKVVGTVPSVPSLPSDNALPSAPSRLNPFGLKAVDSKVLSRKRGGDGVVNELQLKGVVADNRAVNVTTGGNYITEGAFAGTSGIPMVVQNSGNNVLIQNATIVNVQVK